MDNSFASTALRPPVLDGTNYSLWKVKIRYYIKSLDERAWQRVINGWTPPVMIDQEGDKWPKPETDWTADEVQNSNHNSKALNAIFTSVGMNMFSLITNCTSAKSAWDILQSHCEGSESVRRTRLRKLTSKFEMNLDMQKKDKEKTIALQASNDSCNELLQISQEVNDSDLCEDSISFITKKIGDYLKRIRDKKKEAQPSKFPSFPAPEKSQKYPAKQQFQPRNEGNGQYNPKRYDSVQCRECKGFGDYANECANRLRKNKGYNVSLSDEESDVEEKSTDEESQTSLTALFTENRWLQMNPLVCLKSTTSGNLSGDDESEADYEELTLESVQKLYEELFENWTKRNKLNSSLMKENVELKAVVAKLEVILSKKDLELGHWYFDSGSSCHMTGSRECLTDYVEQKGGKVTYGGGAKGKIVGKDTLKVEGLPKLHNCIMTGSRSSDNFYEIGEELLCKHVQITELDLWHQKLGHANFKTLKNLSKYDAVRGMSNLSSGISYVCGDCQKGKQTRVSHPVLPTSGITCCLELLHMDLMGPMELLHMDLTVRRIRTDHGKEFENISFSSFCDRKDISHELSAPKTPQQNGIAERKNKAMQEMARVMLASKNISKRFWAEALNTACHISNMVYLRNGSTMTSYEIIMGKKPNLKYFHVFGCVCYTLNDRDQLAKFDSKSDKCLFLGYATNSRAYRMFNLRTRTIMESINVVFDDCADLKRKTAEDDVEDLLGNPISLENADVAPDVATSTSGTTCDT
ncbi:uncharacterized protein LOC142511387 [Primulina tabacum]|uniref:uncharacterized protein LOC142511387 n=1 Tax=Primulina tabacum TaxID=48773 RepID=UPI003F59B64E